MYSFSLLLPMISREIVSQAVVSCWVLLTVVALVSPFILSENIISHGKQRAKGSRFSVPKTWFSHFYVLAFLISIGLFFLDRGSLSFCMHALRRLVEQLFLFPYPRESKMHVLAYLLGLVFYPLVGVSFWCSQPQQWNMLLWVCFLSFSFLQFSCHKELARLRAGGQYAIPVYAPFRYVLCPHYLAEILLYCLWAVSPGYCMQFCAVFVIVSLAVNALKQRAWYLSLFGSSLPAALIPLVL